MRTIAIIGAGGIGSYAIQYLKTLTADLFIKVFDGDIVEEKNLLYQNFSVYDLMKNKAEAIGNKWHIDNASVFITEENISLLNDFDDIILCVDNNKARQLIYKYALEKNKYLLDLKAFGTMIGYTVIDKTKNMEYYNAKYFSDIERKGSCQMAEDIAQNHIENGNRIIACIGILGIYLKHTRLEQPSTNEWIFAY